MAPQVKASNDLARLTVFAGVMRAGSVAIALDVVVVDVVGGANVEPSPPFVVVSISMDID